MLLHHGAQKVEIPHAVLVVHEAVMEHAERLMRPNPRQHLCVLNRHAHHRHALEHLGQVTHVEGVVRLGRRRQELVADRIVNLERRLDNRGALGDDVVVQLRALAPPVHDGLVHERERFVVELGNAHHVEVAQVTGRDGVASAARRAHRRDELEIHERAERLVGPVEPARVVLVLAQNLHGRLGAVGFKRRHVEIVDEHHAVHAERGTVDALPALVELRVDDVLDLVGVGLSGEGALDGEVLRAVERRKRLLDVHRFASPGRAAKEDVFVVGDERVQQVAVAHGIDRLHDDGVKLLLWVESLHIDGLHPLQPRARRLVKDKVVDRAVRFRGPHHRHLGRRRFDLEPRAEINVRDVRPGDELAHKLVKFQAPVAVARPADAPHQ
mmetsp:Transcript_23994/g.78049  ORF Transcript_23994/g.78049 Transcript_23994/m.78049 type:complete len:383 (+) Transcript_23994:1924-3072(+)